MWESESILKALLYAIMTGEIEGRYRVLMGAIGKIFLNKQERNMYMSLNNRKQNRKRSIVELPN